MVAFDDSLHEDEDAHDALAAYTLTHGDPAFIHQHVVDAYAAQQAHDRSKPIGVAFALAGLYLLVEARFTGRQVQRAHMQMAQRKRAWPRFDLPVERGSMTAVDVMAAPAGAERDRAIDVWCAVVWEAYRASAADVARLAREHGLDAWAAR
jgi:hypothetical protein